jgi:hypothetical protein
MYRTLVGNLEEFLALLEAEVSGKFNVSIDAVEHPVFSFAISAIYAVGFGMA